MSKMEENDPARMVQRYKEVIRETVSKMIGNDPARVREADDKILYMLLNKLTNQNII